MYLMEMMTMAIQFSITRDSVISFMSTQYVKICVKYILAYLIFLYMFMFRHF